jgi:carbonic anhydrase
MPKHQLLIDFDHVPHIFHGLVKHLPQSPFVREVSCDCHKVRMDWQKNGPGHCLPYAFDKGIQKPTWLVISCMDSRFPPELILGVGSHKVCNVRVAGAELGEYNPKIESWRSINLALKHFTSIKGIAFLGHGACGSSIDLMSHFQNTGKKTAQTSIDREVDASYSDEHLKRAKFALSISHEHEEDSRYLRYNFSHVARTSANAATLLGLSYSEKLLVEHLKHLGKDIPVSTFMLSVDPKQPVTPLAMLLKNPDERWINIIKGHQPDMKANMDRCKREAHSCHLDYQPVHHTDSDRCVIGITPV